MNVSGDDIVFFANPTSAVRTLCASLPGSDDEVLATNWEYPTRSRAPLTTWRICAARATSGRLCRCRWAIRRRGSMRSGRATPRTRILHLSHISFTTRWIHPVAEVPAGAGGGHHHLRGSGAHALSQTGVDLAAIDADVYFGACHKWLCAPKGAGFVYAHPRVQALLAEPHVRSRPGAEDAPIEPGAFAASYPYQGTKDHAAVLSVPAAIAFQAEHDWDAQRERCHGLARQTLERITALTGLEPVSPIDSRTFSQMVSIPVPDDRGEAIAAAWKADSIVGMQVKANGRRMLRASFQAYNSQDDADRSVAAVARALGG